MIDTAIILAGGLGTRLRPLTDEIPKPLLPLKGKPILQHVIENLQQHGVKQIILSIGYKAELITDYFKEGSQLGVNISYCLETEPLGTGGAVKKAATGLTKPLFVVWGDNLMDVNYQELSQTYLKHKKPVTMVLTPREDVEHFGVAKLDEEKIISFVEKPKRSEAPSNLINAGAIILEPAGLNLLPPGKSSIEYDYYEKLAPGEITAHIHQGQWFPTDTLEKYALACQNFQPKIDFRKKKVIIADVDDTICKSCQEISLEMAHQINYLIQQGFKFAFISGTGVMELQRMISAKLTEEHHLLGTTGANYSLVHDCLSDKRVTEFYNHTLSQEEKKEIITAFEKLIATYQIQPLTNREDQLQDRQTQITLSALGRNAPSEAKRLYDPQGEKRREWVNFLKNYLDENKYSLKIGGTTSLDVTRKGLDKEWGIREFARYNNINFQDILFFGDKIYPGGNDYPASKIVDCLSVKSPTETLKKLKEISEINRKFI